MHINIIFLIVSSSVCLIVEGLLILRDKNNEKGSTEIDKMTRLFNALSRFIAMLSPVFQFVIPSLNFDCVSYLGTAV